MTEGPIRKAGYWITGGKQFISYMMFIASNVDGCEENYRTNNCPFTYVGVDVFV